VGPFSKDDTVNPHPSSEKRNLIMAKSEKSGKKAASIAGELLSEPSTPRKVKTLAASVLTQAPDQQKKKKKRK
jgi:hypothetical protein